MIFYCLPATLVFAIALHTLLQYAAASEIDRETWIWITAAALLWPVTLPSIIWKKCSALVAAYPAASPVRKSAFRTASSGL